MKDSLSQGLVVWAVNGYCPSQDWEVLVHRLQAIRPGILETTFGEEQAERLEEDLQDLHVRILDGIRGRIARGPLRKSEWNGLHEVTLTVLGFQVRDLHPAPGVAFERRDRLDSEVIAARRTRHPDSKRIRIADLLEETITSAYKSLAVTYDSLSASSADR